MAVTNKRIFVVGVELAEDPNRGVQSPFISAGVALAILQSVYATNQTDFVTNSTLINVIVGICEFLLAKVIHSDDSTQYSINSKLTFCFRWAEPP